MNRSDKGAMAFGLLIIAIMLAGVAAVSLREHWRNESCAALGGIVVGLKCGHFEVIEGWQP
jgi:hypothetical protein